MLAASKMSRITLSKCSFSLGVSSHLVRGNLSFTSSSASIFSLFGLICVRVTSTRRRIRVHKQQQFREKSVFGLTAQGALFHCFPKHCSRKLPPAWKQRKEVEAKLTQVYVPVLCCLYPLGP